MTNSKMPEVGKKYRFKENNLDYEVGRIAYGIKRVSRCCPHGDFRDEFPMNVAELKNMKRIFELETFWDYFEEIPSEPNKQPASSQFVGDNKKEEPTKMQMSGEAREAMKKNLEAIKKAMDIGKYGLTHFERQIFLFCENLLNALENSTIEPMTATFENRPFPDNASASLFKEKYEEQVKILNTNLWGKEKKPSIWKDVSERPEDQAVSIIQLKDGRKLQAAYDANFTGRWLRNNSTFRTGFEVFLPEQVERHCDIADFLTQSESDHQAIAELRERLDKLEGK